MARKSFSSEQLVQVRALPLLEDNTRNGILRTLSYFVYRNPLEAVSLARSRFTISSTVFLLKSSCLPIWR